MTPLIDITVVQGSPCCMLIFRNAKDKPMSLVMGIIESYIALRTGIWEYFSPQDYITSPQDYTFSLQDYNQPPMIE